MTVYFLSPLQSTRYTSADSVPTSNLVCIKEVAIRTTLCIAGLIDYICNLVTDIQCTRFKNAFNKRFLRILSQNKSAKIYSDNIITVCNAVYFRLCIDRMHILPQGLEAYFNMHKYTELLTFLTKIRISEYKHLPPVTAEGFDGSHHPRFAE